MSDCEYEISCAEHAIANKLEKFVLSDLNGAAVSAGKGKHKVSITLTLQAIQALNEIIEGIRTED